MRESVALDDAKTRPSSLVDRAAAGEKFLITTSGKPMARLMPLEDTCRLRTPGRGRGQWQVGRGFDDPLPDALLDAFEGA